MQNEQFWHFFCRTPDTPANDTPALIKGAMAALRYAFKHGFTYQAAGVHAMDLLSEGSKKQKQMFADEPAKLIVKTNCTPKSESLKRAIDLLKLHGSRPVGSAVTSYACLMFYTT